MNKGTFVACAILVALSFAIAQPAQAQRIPDVPKPIMVGFPCPFCGGFVDTPGERVPAVCPHCKRPFSQKPAAGTPASSLLGPMKPIQSKPRLEAINPFGDFLFYDVPIIPDDGKLQTRHFDPDGIAARAEEWAKQMKSVEEQTRQIKETQAKEFEKNKESALKSAEEAAAAAGKPQLRNTFGTGTGDSDKPLGTPMLLRNPYQAEPGTAPGAPIYASGPFEDSNAKKTQSEPGKPVSAASHALGDTIINWDALQAKSGVTKIMTPYDSGKVDKILTDGGWVIVARDLGNATSAAATNWKVGEDNPYGKHWQMLLPNGQSVGYFGEVENPDGTRKVDIGGDKSKVPAYTGTIASGKDGEVMAQAAKNVSARWEEKYAADPEANRYNLYSRNCQSFTADMLAEYNRLLAANKAQAAADAAAQAAAKQP